MSETVVQSKMKDRKTISRRRFDDYEEVEVEKYTLDELFQKFIKTKELKGLRERTIADHKLIYRYFKEFYLSRMQVSYTAMKSPPKQCEIIFIT